MMIRAILLSVALIVLAVRSADTAPLERERNLEPRPHLMASFVYRCDSRSALELKIRNTSPKGTQFFASPGQLLKIDAFGMSEKTGRPRRIYADETIIREYSMVRLGPSQAMSLSIPLSDHLVDGNERYEGDVVVLVETRQTRNKIKAGFYFKKRRLLKSDCPAVIIR